MKNDEPEIIQVACMGRPTMSQAVKLWIAVLVIGALLLAVWLVPEPAAAPCSRVATQEVEQ